MTLELNQEEVSIIRDLVTRRIGELGPEIHHTRTTEFRENLKKLRDQLEVLQRRLVQTAA